MTAIISTLESLTTALFAVDGAIPTFFTWLISEQVAPYFLLSVGISLLLLGIRIVKSVFYGV